jgi:hypothetical protein
VRREVLRDALAAMMRADPDGLAAAALALAPLGVLDRDPLGNREFLAGYSNLLAVA